MSCCHVADMTLTIVSYRAPGKRHGTFFAMFFPVINDQPLEHEVELVGVELRAES